MPGQVGDLCRSSSRVESVENGEGGLESCNQERSVHVSNGESRAIRRRSQRCYRVEDGSHRDMFRG
jgi:hypothetical protein